MNSKPRRFTHAICRRPGPELGEGLTTADLGSPDHELACRQFEAYVLALATAGLEVTVLDPLPGFPDAHFVEDAAVVTPAVAVIARSGAEARRGEEKSIAEALQPHRTLVPITTPGTLDGGDVLQVGAHFLIGISERTNAEGARQLGACLEPQGFTWKAAAVADGLHFKSSVNAVGEGVVLVEPSFENHAAIAELERIVVPEDEAYAANSLLVNEHLLVPAGFPETRARLEALGKTILEIDTSEFRKMDGGLTCLSLRF